MEASAPVPYVLSYVAWISDLLEVSYVSWLDALLDWAYLLQIFLSSSTVCVLTNLMTEYGLAAHVAGVSEHEISFEDCSRMRSRSCWGIKKW